ncbi:MAG TPA: sulfite exporter TauE/SafE family protein [Solirubrobacteraceae bacterium]|nr:sulfite exporter TauE/SafE family protein [Solirubrobacteraceae bacterium]
MIAFATAGLTHSADHLAAGTLVLLGLFGFAGGIGTTALGPGGVLVTIGLFLLSGLPPAAISGTAIATNVGSAALGTGAFARSGQLRGPEMRRMAAVLIAAAVVGTPLGVLVNAHISGGAFGILLGVLVAAIGVLLVVRERRLRTSRGTAPAAEAIPAAAVVVPLGLAVAVVSGLFGLGGQLLSVPLLISIGAPMLPALGAAQAQSIVIAGVGTIGYALRGAIAWPLVLVVGIPLLAGALLGWRIANAVPADRLRSLLAGVLVAVGAYLIIHNA